MTPVSPFYHLCSGLAPPAPPPSCLSVCPPLSFSTFLSDHKNIFTATSRATAPLLLPVPTQRLSSLLQTPSQASFICAQTVLLL